MHASLITWLNTSSIREERHFLEAHHVLLEISSESTLQQMIADLQVNSPLHDLTGCELTSRIREIQKLYDRLYLLGSIREHDGTQTAIREAYVNLFGGFTLTLPFWIEELEGQLDSLKNVEHAQKRVILLRTAIMRASQEKELPQEIVAELNRLLWHAFYEAFGPSDIQVQAEQNTCLEIFFQIYTPTHYPYQYARMCGNLGNAYRQWQGKDQLAHLHEATTYYHQALQVFTVTDFPIQYAKTQYNLGVTYHEFRDGQQRTHLKQVISCYTHALEVFTLNNFPIQYANLQLNLAIIYYEKTNGEKQANLETSIMYAKRSMEVFNSEIFPIEYARVQHTLGNSYSELRTGDQTANIEEAIACYKRSCITFTIDKFPREYALAQYCMGMTYKNRICEERRKNLEEAISCYIRALQISTLDMYPSEYANIQCRLGDTYLEYAKIQNRLGNRYEQHLAGDQRQNLEEAISSYTCALQIYNLDSFPTGYAAMQNSLGAIYSIREVGTRRQNLEEAITFFNNALQVYTLDNFPLEHARTQVNLGLIYRERIEGEQRTNIETAIACYNTALHFYTQEQFPVEYADLQQSIAVAYYDRIEGQRIENIEKAIAYYTQALRVFTAETYPSDFAKCLSNLSTIYGQRIAGKRRENVETAIQYAEQALKIYTKESFPREYAAAQLSLGTAYRERISGEKRTNLEEAIARYQKALQVYTREAFPKEYALIQNNLSFVYTERIMGKRRTNIEEAIAYSNRALQIYTLESFPQEYAQAQHNLGQAYTHRSEGERRTNIEEAIACYNRALQVYTLESSPTGFGLAQNNLGNAYWMRIAGDQKANLEQAITHYKLALRVYTRKSAPINWAMAQHNLGAVYRDRIVGERVKNVEKAIAHYKRALQVDTIEASPYHHRRTQLQLARTEMQQQHWEAAHEAYSGALAAEDLLIALGTGIDGRDAILTEGLDAAISDGLALIRLSRFPEAAVAIERGRARGLAESLALDAADPDLISNLERRSRYKYAREELIAAQTALNIPQQQIIEPEAVRTITLEIAHTYNQAKTQFDTIIDEIRREQDPINFLDTTIDAETILQTLEELGEAHAFVYLGATAWGGFALIALNHTEDLQREPRFIALDLPLLTENLVTDLIESRIEENGTSVIVGGFAWAQEHNGIFLLPPFSTNATFRQKADSLYTRCTRAKRTSMLDKAAQKLLLLTEFKESVDKPFSQLSDVESKDLRSVLSQIFLYEELKRSLDTLIETALRPLVASLHEECIKNITLIPCGMLAAFPLGAAEITQGKTLNDLFVTSTAPNVQLFRRKNAHKTSARIPRDGVYTLGNPEYKTNALDWGEAEAYTLGMLARSLQIHTEVKVQNKATRRQLIKALNKGYIVDLSCHGRFNIDAPLLSTLRLAGGQTFTLGQILSHEVDLQGLRLLILSACQTAIIDLRGASDEVRSIAVGMLQAGAEAVLASLWPVDDKATYLLMARFAQEWFPTMHKESPAAALARAQHWLRTVTNRKLQEWEMTAPISQAARENDQQKNAVIPEVRDLVQAGTNTSRNTNSQRNYRYDIGEASRYIYNAAHDNDPDSCPYESPLFWAGFQIAGW